jgi:hypothetical protein
MSSFFPLTAHLPPPYSMLLALLLLLCSIAPSCSVSKVVTLTSLAVPRRYSLQRGVDRGPDCSHNTSLGPELRAMGTTLIRTHDAGVLDWCVLFPNPTADPSLPSSYNFAPGDAYFAQITGEGFRPYLRLGSSWTVPLPSCIHPDPAVFAAVAVRTLAHYNDGWAQGFTGRLVSLVELFNEPDEPRFWNGTAAQFYALFDGAARALKAYDPSLQVGGPGVASPLAPASSSYSFGLLDYVQAHSTPVDFFSWHSYGDIASSGSWGHSPQGIYNDTITQLRAALQQRGLGRLQQHVTEWQPAILGNASTTGSAEAASFTASALTFMAQAQDVAVSIFYPACEGTGAQASWGMFADLGNGTLAWRREGRAWGAVGALLQATPWALAAALAPAEADYTALAGSDSAEEAQRTTVSAVLSARATQTGGVVLSAVLGSAAAAAGLASASIYLLSSAVSADGLWSNSTVQVAQDGRVQVSVPGFAPPAVAWVTLAALPAATVNSALLSRAGP